MRLLILGTGSMAHNHAVEFAAIPDVSLVAAVDINLRRVQDFCLTHHIPKAFTSLNEAIEWGEFDAVANATPDSLHCLTTLEVLEAGKHVFCEKPLATNYADALKMVQAAEISGKIGMVNLSYRNVPELSKARELISQGAIGALRHVEASYLQSWLVAKYWGDWRNDPAWLWRLSTKHGSNGVLGDIGIHIVDLVTYATNSDISNVCCRLRTFEKTTDGSHPEYHFDANDSFAMIVDFMNGALGVIHASRWATGHINELKFRAYGDKGGLEFRHSHEGTSLKICSGADVDSGIWKPVPVPLTRQTYQLFAEAVSQGKTLEPSFAQAAKIQQILDIGLSSVT